MIRNRPPPPGYHWGIKLILALALLFISAAFLLAQAYQGPTVAHLAETSDTEKQQGACFDRFAAHVTDGNADALAAMSAEIAAIGGLIVTLAAQPRDQVAVQAGVAAIGATVAPLGKALDAYDKASKERADWVAAGRRLPCPIPN